MKRAAKPCFVFVVKKKIWPGVSRITELTILNFALFFSRDGKLMRRQNKGFEEATQTVTRPFPPHRATNQNLPPDRLSARF